MPPPNDVGYFGQSGSTFYRVLSQAINEMAEVGFDNSARLAYWINRIRDAAVQSLVPEHVLEATLNQAFRATFRRLVEKGGIVKFHPGIARFTLEKVRPALHAELDRRMMVSRNLIKLNRAEAIEATVRRFAGWASSVPDGGTGAVDRRETKAEIRKALASLPFRERRVVIDQGHKFVANLNNILATDGGAIAGQWASNWRQRNYNFRRDHKDRDGKLYVVRGNWALSSGLMRLAGAKYTDEITMPGEEVYCIPGSSPVEFFDNVEKLYRRRYSGCMVTITTKSGTLSGTPNHPILTKNGWVAIGLLDEGDDVIEIGDQGVVSSELHADHGKTSISDVFQAALEMGQVAEVRSGMRPYFHGDGTNDDIDVISFARPLRFNAASRHFEMADKIDFSGSNFLWSGIRPVDEDIYWLDRTADCGMSGVKGLFSEVFAVSNASGFANSGLGDIEDFGEIGGTFSADVAGENFIANLSQDARPVSKINPSLLVPVPHGHDGNTKVFCNGLDGKPLATKSVKVINVDRRPWSGHVYNLQMASGWYAVNGVITSNCRCSYTYVYSLRALPSDMVTEKGRMELARAKALVGA